MPFWFNLRIFFSKKPLSLGIIEGMTSVSVFAVFVKCSWFYLVWNVFLILNSYF